MTIATGNRSGSAEFLILIQETLKPLGEFRFEADPRRQTPFGHSPGGVLLQALMDRLECFQMLPDVFLRPVLRLGGTTSRWSAARKTRPNPVPIATYGPTAGDERRAGKGKCPSSRLAPTSHSREFGSFTDFTQRCQKVALETLSVEFRKFSGENHGSMIPVSINQAIRFTLSPDR